MSDALRARVQERSWYHTMELAPGVVTPGFHDTRALAPQLPWPSLEGQRCLDVGTFDGFWAFEMERRGAREVLAIDVLDPAGWDWPVGSEEAVVAAIGERKDGGSGFEIAHEALGSKVRRLERSVYDAAEAELGRFDFIYVGSLLLHLRDPVRAIEQLAAICDGQLMMVDAIDLRLTWLMRGRPAARLDAIGRPWWWKPNKAALERIAVAAGLELVAPAKRVWLPYGPGFRRPRLSPRRVLAAPDKLELIAAARGRDPHAMLIARPAQRPSGQPA